jgi:multifunctional beta-oxidation protein
MDILADNEETSGSLFEVLGGWAAQTRWQRSGGFSFPTKVPYTPEDVIAKWDSITNFSKFSATDIRLNFLTVLLADGRTTNPSTGSEAMEQVSFQPLLPCLADFAF